MFGFLKKLFGSDAETNKAAGIQIEQTPVIDTKIEAANQAPYKVEPPILDLADIAIAQRPAPVAVPTPVAEVAKKAPAKKKPQAAKTKAEKVVQKPAAITAPKKASRKSKV